jgi:hypothetical protein
LEIEEREREIESAIVDKTNKEHQFSKQKHRKSGFDAAVLVVTLSGQHLENSRGKEALS